MKGKNSFKIIDLSLKYSRITIMIVTAILLTGIYGLYVMPKKDFASFTIRQGVVICVQPGLTSTEIEEQITEQLEEFILNFDEIKKGKTTSQSRDGVCIINIELKENIHDTNTFWSKFKHKLNNFKQELPPDVLSLFVIDDFGETSAFLFSIESSTKSYEDIKNYIDALKKDLRNVEGISNIKEYGLLKEQITLYIDQDKLSHYGFGYEYITAKLFLQGLTLASGNIDDSKIVIPIHVENQYVTEKDIGEQIIYSDLDGNIVRLKDIAKIVREYPNSSPYIEHNGTKCVLLSIDVGKNENVVEIGNDVNQIVDIFKDNLPDDVIVSNICDLSQVVNKAVISFLIELLIAVVAVVSVVLIFMPKRIAFVAAITIPITMFSSLAVFYLIGIELNTVIFSALIVTLGMVVDDSVVIIDNYVEQLDEGKSRLEAAIESPKKYFKSVLTATLVISVTFFPFLWTTKGMFNDLNFSPSLDSFYSQIS